MRVLATWDPSWMLAIHEIGDLESEAALGALPDTDADDWFGWSTDPREDFDSEEWNEPCSYLRETEHGIQCKRHPEAMLRDSPQLWDIVSKWRSGVRRELSREEYATLSNFEIECWLVLQSAHSREELRRLKEKDPGDGVSD